MYDTPSNLVYVDHEDNAILVIVKGAADGPFKTAIGEIDKTHVPIKDGWVTVGRATDTLFVVRPDSQVARFPLPANVVRKFHEQRRGVVAKRDYLADAEKFLDEANVQRLREFVLNSPAL